ADRLVEHDPAMDVAPVAARLIVLALLVGTRIVVDTPRVAALRVRKNIFFNAVRLGILRRDRVVCGGDHHHSSFQSGARSARSAGTVMVRPSRSASCPLPCARISAIAWRTVSPTRNGRCEPPGAELFFWWWRGIQIHLVMPGQKREARLSH